MEELQQLPYFLLNYDTSLKTVANTQTISTPTGFLLEDDYSEMFVKDTDGNYTRVIKENYATLRGSIHFDTNKLPEFFALQGTTLHFFPIPNAIYSLDWHYYKADTVLSSNVANAWLNNASGVMIGKAGMLMGRFMRDPMILKLFEADFVSSLDRLWKTDEARRQAALLTQMGG